MWLSLETRPAPSRVLVYTAPLLALLMTLLSGLCLFGLLGQEPWLAMYTFWVRPLEDLYGWSELTVKAAPLLLCAVGVGFGFRAGVWNIGAEGQLTLGAIGGGALALAFPDAERWWLLPAMVAVSAFGGALWAAIPAWLRTRFNTNEILTSLMLTYIAVLLLGYLVHGPLRDPGGYNLPESALFSDAALFPLLVEGTRMHLGVIFAAAAALIMALVLTRTLLGFQARVIGLDPSAARYAGFSQTRMVWVALLLGGALAGLAGLGEVAGPIGQLRPQISPGYGFAAIIVAYLGRLHPIGMLFASLLMALVYLGGEMAQIQLGVPLALTALFQGLLLFYMLIADALTYYRVRWRYPADALRRG